MQTPRTILFNQLPCWYELTWRPELGVVLRIHEDFVNGVKQISSNAPIIGNLQDELNLDQFVGQLGQDFGFGASLKFLGMADHFLEYHIPATTCRKEKEKPCSSCEGSGKSWEEGGKCLFCGGSGKDIYYDYREASHVAASLSLLLLTFLRFPKVETTCPLPQLMEIQTHISNRSSYGAPLGGIYGQEVVSFLRNRPNGTVPRMVEAMIATHVAMDQPLREFDYHLFSAYTQGQDGWLNISCPGEACGLHPSNGYIDRGDRGYEFSCHNTDQPIQQMTLLSALAALHNLVRASSK